MTQLTVEQAIAIADQSWKEGRIDPAREIYQSVINAVPNHAQAIGQLGLMEYSVGQFEKAKVLLEKAVQFSQNPAERITYLGNFGNCLKQLGQGDQAIECFLSILQTLPDVHVAHYNIGCIHIEHGRLDEAVPYLEKAIQLCPTNPDYRYNLGFTHLLNGNLKPGWEGYEWRWKRPAFTEPIREWPYPLWEGQSLENRHLLVISEQGAGDNIQFFRFAKLLAEQGVKITVEAPAGIFPLFELNKGKIFSVIEKGSSIPEADFYVPIMSLAQRMRYDNQEALPSEPYLSAPSVNAPTLDDSKLKIGLVWSGNPQYSLNSSRSSKIDFLSHLFKYKQANFYSLQVGCFAPDINPFLSEGNVVDLSDELTDFAITANVLGNLDLMITTDTSVCHLAGALGVKTWSLLSYIPDWRWGLSGTASPWYDSMALYRQKSEGNWAQVSAALESDFQKFLKENSHP